jgi:hypothetical protein
MDAGVVHRHVHPYAERRRSVTRRAWPAAALLAVCLVVALMGAGTALAGTAVSPAPDFSIDALLARAAVQQTVITSAGGGAGNDLGYSVAVSGDTALAGAPGYAGSGAAYVFVRSGGTWTQQALLSVGALTIGDQFGASVALDGDTALVGARFHDSGGVIDSGAAYVFTRSGSSWILQKTLSAGAGMAANDQFGSAVALEGDTAAVGAEYRPLGAATGAVYVFVRSGTTWTQQGAAPLTAADGVPGDRLGGSVAISGDTILVSAAWRDSGGLGDSGAAYVFTRSGTTWTQQGSALTASPVEAAEWFGVPVALEGDNAVLGAVGHDTAAGTFVGAAYVFTRSGTTWAQQARLLGSDSLDTDVFGSAVALSGDVALIGAPQHDTAAGADAGAAYAFARTGTTWTQKQKLTASDGAAGDRFGGSACVAGATELVGAPGRTVSGDIGAGAVYVFVEAPTVKTFAPASGVVGANVVITGTGFSDPTKVTFNGKAAAVFAADSDTQITAKVPSGASTGKIAVTTAGGTATSTASFTVKAKPTITKIRPTAGKRGATVTITGTKFASRRGSGFVKFGSKKCGKYISWSATKIKCKVPSKAAFGSVKVTVTTSGGVSKGKTFKVKR